MTDEEQQAQQPSEEELRAALEEQLRKITVTDVLLQTVVTLAGAAVAVLAGLRFSVEGRRVDLLLACGFFVGAASTLCFSISPVLGGHAIGRSEAWSGVVGRLLAWTLIAAAPTELRGASDWT